MFDLTIKTLQGSCKFQSPPELTVAEFKTQLHNAATAKRLSGLNVPTPENQNLVYNGRALRDGSLEEAGIQSGDSLVILSIPEPPVPPPRPTLRAPSAEEIAEAIKAYSIRHGLESKLTAPEKPRPRTRGLASTDRAVFGSDQLQVIIDALEESLGRHSSTDTRNEEEPEEPLNVPDPEPLHMECLTEEMGISAELARKALILHRNNLTAAVNWICEHQDDEDVLEPIPEATLRSLYGRRRHQRRNAPRQDLVQQLVDMGFEEEQSREALARTRNNLELAVSSLVHRSGEQPTQEPPETQPHPETLSESTPAAEIVDPEPTVQPEQELEPTNELPVEPGQSSEAVPPPPALNWTQVEMAETEGTGDEPPSSEAAVNLMGDSEEDIIVGDSDFDQGELGGVSLEDVERVLGGEGDPLSSRALYPQLRRLLEGIGVQLMPEALQEDDDEATEESAAAFLGRLRELVSVLGANAQNEDPSAPGPSGEVPDHD